MRWLANFMDWTCDTYPLAPILFAFFLAIAMAICDCGGGTGGF